MNYPLKSLAVGLLLLGSCVHSGRDTSSKSATKNEDWTSYGGNKAGNRYSPLTQINTGNVQNLKLAWSYDTGENNNPNERGIDIQCQPIVVNGILYGTSPRMKLFAVKANTGEQI